MYKILSALAFCTLSLTAMATTHKEAPNMSGGSAAPAAEKMATPQQSKMAVCNKEATDKKGDERKAFMKSCLTNAKATQQTKMKTCNVDAKTQALKGDARKTFMKTCLSNKPA